MRRGTIILLIFAIIAVGILVASQFLFSRPPLTLTVAVSPLFEDAARAAAETFNTRGTVVNANRRIAIQVIAVDDMDVWLNQVEWADNVADTTRRPMVWIPAASFSADYIAGDRRLPFTEIQPSVAQTVLMWGGFRERAEMLTDYASDGLDWAPVAQSAEIGQWAAIGGDASWQYLDLAFAAPDQATAGVAVLLSGGAAYHETTLLTDAQLRDSGYRDWIAPVLNSVPNFNSLGADPAQAIAQRGLSIADIALLPESQWITNLSSIGQADAFIVSYPTYQVVFDFPALVWDSPSVTVDERAGAEAFINYLMSDTQQNTLPSFGLRLADGTIPETGADLFTMAAAYGVLALPDRSNVVEAPPRATLQSLLTWYGQIN